MQENSTSVHSTPCVLLYTSSCLQGLQAKQYHTAYRHGLSLVCLCLIYSYHTSPCVLQVVTAYSGALCSSKYLVCSERVQ